MHENIVTQRVMMGSPLIKRIWWWRSHLENCQSESIQEAQDTKRQVPIWNSMAPFFQWWNSHGHTLLRARWAEGGFFFSSFPFFKWEVKFLYTKVANYMQISWFLKSFYLVVVVLWECEASIPSLSCIPSLDPKVIITHPHPTKPQILQYHQCKAQTLKA